MNRKTVVSTAELTRMAEVANAQGVTIELEREGVIVRVSPFRTSVPAKKSREEEAEDALARWVAHDKETR